MSKQAIKFGTDGWRAVIAEEYTFENVRTCAQAVAMFLKSQGLAERGLVIGYDYRFASENFADAVAEVVTANGIKCYRATTAIATPITSFATIHVKAGGAVVITASHNPAAYNGFKYKPDYGGSASPEVVAQLEANIEQVQAGDEPARLALAEARQRGLLIDLDCNAPFRAQIERLVDLDRIREAGFHVAVDSMYGVGAGWFKDLLAGGKTTVSEIHGERNPAFPGMTAPEPIARNLGALTDFIKESGATVGLATDGDADRLGIMDENGLFVNQLQVFALLCYYLLEIRGERGPIVKSLTTTRMANRLGEAYGVPVYETAVGFKYLGPKMMETDAIIGGEESGGYGFRGHIPERDGILSGLYFLDMMARTGKTPSQLLRALYDKVGEHYYDRIDIHLDPSQRQDIFERARSATPSEVGGMKVESIDSIDGFRFNLEGGGWLLLRFSGTEPLLRIYTEVTDKAKVPELLAAGKALVGLS